MSAPDAVLVHLHGPRSVTMLWSDDEERWNWKLHHATPLKGSRVVGGGHWDLCAALADAGRAVQ
ncbi:MAG TPA: hypothetical protein VNE39_28845, partial [Planctomycetota bacterium]|nr:hypothetical protein [Planctomycetota bacterium]